MILPKINLLKVAGIAYLLLLNTGLFAQEKSIEVAKVALEDKSYKKALKNALDATENPETSKMPEGFYLVAASYLKLAEDPFYLEKNPETIETAMKYASKGMSKDAGMKAFPEYKAYLRELIKANNKEADAFYQINKINKAMRAYQNSFELMGDTTAFFWLGKLYLASGDTTTGLEYYKQIVNWYYESFMKSKDNNGFQQDPFVYFADRYWNKKQYDSANYYLELGRTIFGATNKLDFFQQKIAWEQINNMPPSNMMMDVIQKTLKYFPTDTALLKKENALYLYLIRNSIDNKDSVYVVKYMDEFTQSKISRFNSKDKKAYEKYDEFIDEKAENVYWLLTNYYHNYNHPSAASFLAKKYISATAASASPADLENRWVVIIDYASKSKSLGFTKMLTETALQQFPSSKSISDIRKTVTMTNMDKQLNTADKGALRALVLSQSDLKSNADVQKKLKNINSVYVDDLIKEKNYILAKRVIFEEKNKDSLNPLWEKKLQYLAKEDFFYNYYETRTKPDTVAGMITNNFVWNGDISRCKPGEIDVQIQQKVENRINYFRRNAGVPEIFLDPKYNDWCQKAALMMEVNRKLDHDPKRNWSCYSEEGATAAKYSLLIQNSNTSYAVTSFMADNNNVSLGNRRWMLYQNGKIFGHGSTENYCSIWALDDSGSTDTSMYKNQFVAWPPEGYTPKLIVFKNWSFSIYRDLKGATVSMTENGKPVALKQHPVVEGYGMPTLVWTPEIKLDKNEDRVFEVNIKLADGRLYKYKVVAMDFDAIGY